MGTNFYLRRKQPTIREAIHICKRSWGFYATWQATEPDDWPKWCDEDMMSPTQLPSPIRSVDDIRDYLRTGEWEVVDEYGDVHPDSVIDDLEAWDGGKAAYNADRPDQPVTWTPKGGPCDFKDDEGNRFSRRGFC